MAKYSPDLNPLQQSKSCHACGRPVLRCVICSKDFYPMRTDATTCTDNCRQMAHYRTSRGLDLRTGKAVES